MKKNTQELLHNSAAACVSQLASTQLQAFIRRLMQYCAALLLLISSVSFAAGMPAWVFAPIQISASNLVFSGAGDSYEAAQLNALATLMTQLSSQVQTKQQLSLSTQAGQSQQSFTEHTTVHTLNLDISGLTVLQQYENAGEHAIQLSIARQALEHALLDRITEQTQLVAPQAPPKNSILWALQNKGRIAQAQRYERALAGLKFDTSRQRQQLQQQSQLTNRALQHAGIRIIHPQDTQSLVAALAKQFPNSTDEHFWLKVEQRSLKAKTSQNFLHRLVVNLSLMDAQQPFTPYLNQEITLDGAGQTANAAAQDAQKKLLDHVNQDLSVWFFY